MRRYGTRTRRSRPWSGLALAGPLLGLLAVFHPAPGQTSSGPAHSPQPDAGPLPGPDRVKGVIPAYVTRPMKPCHEPRLAELLRSYEEPPGEVPWAMTRIASWSTFDVYDLCFPSPVATATPENNTVWCEYFRCRGDHKRPAAIVLHILDGRFRESRLICSYLATFGIDGLLLKMAYYGPRRPKDPARFRTLTQDLDTLCEATRQSVMDARRAARWLVAQPQVDAGRISIVGTSLGGFVGSVASGVDGGFYRSVFVLAGGRIETVLTTPTDEVRTVRQAIESAGLSRDELIRKLAPIEPCTFARRIDPRSVLMFNTRHDPIVPPASARALADAIGGARIVWYDGDHYSLIWRIPELLARLRAHLTDITVPPGTSREAGG